MRKSFRECASRVSGAVQREEYVAQVTLLVRAKLSSLRGEARARSHEAKRLRSKARRTGVAFEKCMGAARDVRDVSVRVSVRVPVRVSVLASSLGRVGVSLSYLCPLSLRLSVSTWLSERVVRFLQRCVLSVPGALGRRSKKRPEEAA